MAQVAYWCNSLRKVVVVVWEARCWDVLLRVGWVGVGFVEWFLGGVRSVKWEAVVG